MPKIPQKSSPKGDLGEPSGSKMSDFLVYFLRVFRRWAFWCSFGPFWDQISIKNKKKQAQGNPKGSQNRKKEQLNIYAKIGADKYAKNIPKGS